MTKGLKWTVNEVPKSDDKYLELMSEENIKKANEFHRSFPQYSVTPLQNLSSLAKYLGVKNIFCKDESYRFGLMLSKYLEILMQWAAILQKNLDVISASCHTMFSLLIN